MRVMRFSIIIFLRQMYAFQFNSNSKTINYSPIYAFQLQTLIFSSIIFLFQLQRLCKIAAVRRPFVKRRVSNFFELLRLSESLIELVNFFSKTGNDVCIFDHLSSLVEYGMFLDSAPTLQVSERRNNQSCCKFTVLANNHYLLYKRRDSLNLFSNA